MTNLDPKYLGIDNICFSLTSKDDAREEQYSRQRIQRGFDDSELWSLDITIAKFIAPRLKAFIEGCGSSNQEFLNDCSKVLEVIEMISKEEHLIKSDCDYKKIDEGLELFSKIFMKLWI